MATSSMGSSFLDGHDDHTMAGLALQCNPLYITHKWGDRGYGACVR